MFQTDQFTLFYNTHFPEDPVFNHAVIRDDILETADARIVIDTGLLDDVKSEAARLGVPASIFIENFWEGNTVFESAAIDSGYLIGERMDLLLKSVGANSPALEATGVEVSETDDIEAWNRVFMLSYGIDPSWKQELHSRETSLLGNARTKLFLASEKGSEVSHSGCILLHRFPDDCMGVYCVGTLPERRSRGIAREMLIKAEDIAAKQACKLLTLQTVTSEEVTPMYLKFGFKVEFRRDILQCPEP